MGRDEQGDERHGCWPGRQLFQLLNRSRLLEVLNMVVHSRPEVELRLTHSYSTVIHPVSFYPLLVSAQLTADLIS